MIFKNPQGLPFDFNSSSTIFCGGKIFSYEDLYQRVIFYYKQIKSGSIIAALATNSFDFISLYIASLNSDACLILLNDNIQSSLLDKYIDSFKIDLLFASSKPVESKFSYETKCDFLYNISIDSFVGDINRLPILLLPTSGSTGSAKFVKVSRKNLEANTNSIVNYLDINSSSHHITSLPASYTFGLSCLNTHISSGSHISLTDSNLLDANFWQIVKDRKPNTFSGVPYSYQILEKFGFSRLSSYSFTTFTQAGGKLNNTSLQKFASFCSEYDKKFFVMYGQTEATARMSYLPPSSLSSKIGSIGIAIPGGTFSLSYDDIYPSPSSYKVGELVYEGENVTCGYASSLDDLMLTESRKKLFTGDLAYVDSEGFYFITGRKSRFSKIKGVRLSLDDLESAFDIEYYLVSDDEYIYIFSENSSDLIDIKKLLSERFSLPSNIFKPKFISQFPRSESGKILYSAFNALI